MRLCMAPRPCLKSLGQGHMGWLVILESDCRSDPGWWVSAARKASATILNGIGVARPDSLSEHDIHYVIP